MTYMSPNITIDWQNLGTLSSKKYTCGYCGNPLASNRGYAGQYRLEGNNIGGRVGYIYICHYCHCPTFFDIDSKQHPGHPFGNAVEHIPSKEVENLYNEARNCFVCGAYTASVLCCRKLLMNIAVSLEAAVGLNFKEYVDFLYAKNYIPPGGKDWVDYIREKGNDANHEIALMIEEDAKKLVDFSEMLLKIIYEYPEKGKRKKV